MSSFGVGREPFLRNGCPVTACEIFVNRSALPFSEFDAVLINMHEIAYFTLPEQEGYNRSGHQRYVFFTQESAQSMPIQPSKYRNYFNWTMSYRWDSDVPLLYGRIRPLPSAPADESEVEILIRETHKWTTNYAQNKNKTVAWMASHCETNGLREKYVQELSKFIDVDVYGGCGKLKCARNATHWLSEPECYTLLEREYKFYLSFENSVCTDYVTEKFFNILKYDLVPVVYGGANYSAIAPPNSFINAMEFTPLELANYLKMLSNNDTLYNEFFWWKDYYAVEAGVEQMSLHGFCDLCRKLHEDSTIQVNDDIQTKWNASNQCTQMTSWLSTKFGL